MKNLMAVITLLLAFASLTYAQDNKKENFTATTISAGTKIPANSKVYINPMDGFETYVTAAIQKKKIPVLIVANREQADFEVKGSVEKQKAGWAKTIFVSPLPEIDATMQVVNLRTGVVVFSNSSNKNAARRGRKGSAEHLAKNLAQKMQDDGDMIKE